MFKSLKLYLNQELNLEELFFKLSDFGYKRFETVTEEGEFARRGGIIDIFPMTFESPIRLELDNKKISSIKSFDTSTGRTFFSHKLVIILPSPRFKYKSISYKTEEIPLNNFIDLKKGDYVVHNRYGIGRYLGRKRLFHNGKLQDYLIIQYDKKERLFVPLDDAHLIQKYIAFTKSPPRLHRLTTKEWLRTKERVKRGVFHFARELLYIQALRQAKGGFSFSKDTDWQRIFEESFPYPETPAQIKATEEVKEDMESARPMDRLLCGDVGYGKTEVAMRAAFKAVMDGKQVAFLVPTTILAEQHYHNFQKRINQFPINVEMLSRFKSKTEQEKIIKGLREGKVDIVIGTHRLLSSDIKFYNLGLLIIDEEQRFGVKAKEKLKKLRVEVDILTLTATPIPRTLYMSLMGAKDISIINTPPQQRLPISTYVAEYDEDLIFQAIHRELKRKGQVYFVHNRILDIEKITESLKRLVPNSAKIAFAHGRMRSSLLEKIMLLFLERKIDVLVSTSIIASGIDIPNANTLIVNNAHCFGLADLHQLRGRVGRFRRKAYAYFLIPKKEILTKEAQTRLKTIEEYAELGSGFRIAMQDLEIRGAGNILGEQQHGFIMAVGFDLYCRLLKEAVDTLKVNLSRSLQNV